MLERQRDRKDGGIDPWTRQASSKLAGRLALVMLAAVLLLAAANAPGLAGRTVPVTVAVEGPAGSVVPGQRFVVSIRASDAANLGSFEFFVNFDTDVVSAAPADIRVGSLLGSTGRTVGELRRLPAQPAEGQAVFGAYSYGNDAGADGTGLLATMEMTAEAEGTSVLALNNLMVTTIDGTEVPSVAQAGSVTVESEPLPPTHRLYLPTLLKVN